MKLDFADFVTSLGPYCQYTQKAKVDESENKGKVSLLEEMDELSADMDFA